MRNRKRQKVQHSAPALLPSVTRSGRHFRLLKVKDAAAAEVAWHGFVPEMLQVVGHHLDLQSLLSARTTCHHWHRALSSSISCMKINLTQAPPKYIGRKAMLEEISRLVRNLPRLDSVKLCVSLPLPPVDQRNWRDTTARDRLVEGVTDVLSRKARLTSLTVLSHHGCIPLKHLSTLTNLKYLDLTTSVHTSSDIYFITGQCMQLESLKLSHKVGMSYNRWSLYRLTALKNLRCLDTGCTPLREEVIKLLSKLTWLTELRMTADLNLYGTPPTLLPFHHLSSLMQLRVLQLPSLAMRGGAYFEPYPHMWDWDQLFQPLVNLEDLEVDQCKVVDGHQLRCMRHLRALKRLVLNMSTITPVVSISVDVIKGILHIPHVEVNFDWLTECGCVRPLYDLPNLKCLTFNFPRNDQGCGCFPCFQKRFNVLLDSMKQGDQVALREALKLFGAPTQDVAEGITIMTNQFYKWRDELMILVRR